MIDQFINFVVRPPRVEYNPDQYLWEKDFTLGGRKYIREDLELTNERGHSLRCSHYVPSQVPEDVPLPCVIYCHGNSLLYGAEDPSIAGMVLDSAFSNLFNLMMELADVYKIRLPKFTVKVGIQYMRSIIQRKAKFDIMQLDCVQVAPKSFIPALFGHTKDD